MLRAHAKQAAESLLSLFHAHGPKDKVVLFIEQGVDLLTTLDEPMVWEHLFKDVSINRDGKITWNGFFPERAWVRYAGLQLLPMIHKGAMIDESLWAQHISKLNLQEEPLLKFPEQLHQLPNVTELILPKELV